METVQNQKVVKVNKEKSDKEHLYTIISLDALQYVCLDELTPAAMKLWLYFMKNQNGYTMALSKVDAMKWGIGSKSSYDRAVKELKDKGYLIAAEGNYWNFYDIPPEAKQTMLVRVNKE